jgi:hypothetical protein
VNLKSKIREKLREVYGPFNTYLEHEYENKLTDNLFNGDSKLKREWITYNQVILELKHNIKDGIKVKELQYKLTEDSPPNEACIEVIYDIKNLSPELYRLYNKINNF